MLSPYSRKCRTLRLLDLSHCVSLRVRRCVEVRRSSSRPHQILALNEILMRIMGMLLHVLTVDGVLGTLGRSRTFINIMLKESLSNLAIRKDHFPSSMLYTSHPISLITAPIRPSHLSVAISFIVLVLSLITVTTLPLKHPKAVLLIIQVVSFILITLRSLPTSPFTFAVLEAIKKFANIYLSVPPSILTFTIRFTFLVFPCVHISITEYVCSLSVF